MKVEQNTISRDWTIINNGRKFYVNFTESDGQTLTLCNRDNWQISEETDNGTEKLSGCVFGGMTAEQRRKAQKDIRIVKEIITFCIEYWDNQFMQEFWQELVFSVDDL